MTHHYHTTKAIAIMYDISGSDESLWIDAITADWVHLQKDFGLTKSSSYMHHDQKPVLAASVQRQYPPCTTVL